MPTDQGSVDIETSSWPGSPEPTQPPTNNWLSERNTQEGSMLHRQVLSAQVLSVGLLVMLLTASPAWAQLDQSFGQEGTVVLDDEAGLIAWAAARLPDGSIAVGGSMGESAEPEDQSPWLTVVSPDGKTVSAIDLGAFGDDIGTIDAVAPLGDRLLVVARTVGADDCSTAIASLALDGSPDPEFGTSGLIEIDLCGADDVHVAQDRIHVTGDLTADGTNFHRVATIGLDGFSIELDAIYPRISSGRALVWPNRDPIIVEYLEQVDSLVLRTSRLDGTEIDSAPIGEMTLAFGGFQTAHGYLGYIGSSSTSVLPYLIHPGGAIDTFDPIVPQASVGAWETVRTAYDRLGRVVQFATAQTSFSIDLVDLDGRLLETVGEIGESGAFTYPAAAFLDDRRGSMLVVADEVFEEKGGDVVIASYILDNSGRFIDDDASVHENDIETIASTGVTRGCNPPLDTEFCPTDPVTRGQMASFLVRALELAPADDAPFTDTAGSVHAADIAALAQAGITTGCTADRYCPENPVTRGQMASFLVRSGAGDR
jgi:hypothetical protein